jgi:D-alanyl-lipoteichoic acid acyltransferase DltB (MBOAT superfamily)
MMPQFALKRNLVKNYRNIASGIFIFSIGLFKKVVIADTFAVWATAGFDKADTLNFFEGWFTSLSYTFQIYFDFSGYTDMAIGIALLFNIKLPINFNSPYKATSIQDFWRRWHITLSRFLKDYIYIPFGGNRKGELKTYINLMTTFIIGGIWHGASWLFVLWGFLHGLALVIHRAWSKFGFKLWSWLAWFITFNFINISWIFFRAKSWEDAIKVLNGMFSLDIILPNRLSDKLSFLKEYGFEFGRWVVRLDNRGIGLTVWLIFGLILVLMFKNSNEQLKYFKPNSKTILLSTITFSLAVLSLNKISEFLYFDF